MDGFLNVFKEKGCTSYDVIRKLKKILKISRIGHAGNLDPMAEGVLVVGIGKATRFIEYIMNETKEYRVKVKFGVLTTTLDVDGEIIEEMAPPKLDRERVQQVLEKFLGEIEQVPPSVSALKFEGKRLYEYAREGVYLVPKPRKVKISKIDLLEVSSDYIVIDVECSSGTYMRALARDIGKELENIAIVSELTRLRVNDFRIEDSKVLDSMGSEEVISSLIPISKALPFKSSVILNSKGAFMFNNGNVVRRGMFVKTSQDARVFTFVKVFDQENNFLGVGFLTWEGLEPKKVYVPGE